MEAQGIFTLVRGLLNAPGLGLGWDIVAQLQPPWPIQIPHIAAVCAEGRQMIKSTPYFRKNSLLEEQQHAKCRGIMWLQSPVRAWPKQYNVLRGVQMLKTVFEPAMLTLCPGLMISDLRTPEIKTQTSAFLHRLKAAVPGNVVFI